MSNRNTGPVVVIATNKTNNLSNQTYKNVVCIENTDAAPWPDFYNDVLNKKLGHLVFCLGDEKPLNYRYVEEVVKVFIRNPQAIGALYTDTNYNIFPSFSDKILINPPIIISGMINGKLFDSRLSNLYYFDVLRKLNNKSIVYHIPKRLVSQDIKINPKKDLEILQCHV
jgi:hypothetical protein